MTSIRSLHTSPVCCFHLSQKKKKKKLCCYDCVTYIGGCHGDHPPCCQATCDWPCQPLIGWGLLKIPKMLSEKKKTWHMDWVLLPLLSTSKSCLLSSLFWFMYSLIYLCICRRERQLGEALGTACSTFPLKGWMQHQKKPLSFESQLKSMAANPCSEYTQKNVGPILLWIRVKWGFARCHGNREGKTCCLKDGTVAASLWL